MSLIQSSVAVDRPTSLTVFSHQSKTSQRQKNVEPVQPYDAFDTKGFLNRLLVFGGLIFV